MREITRVMGSVLLWAAAIVGALGLALSTAIALVALRGALADPGVWYVVAPIYALPWVAIAIAFSFTLRWFLRRDSTGQAAAKTLAIFVVPTLAYAYFTIGGLSPI